MAISLPLSKVTLNVTDGKHGDCANESGSGYYFISVKDIGQYSIDYSEAREITEDDFLESHKRTKLESGDILLANSGHTIGKMLYVEDIPEVAKTTFQKSVAIIKPDKQRIDGKYLYYFLRASVEGLRKAAVGSAQPNLLLGDLRDFPVQVDKSISEQKGISCLLYNLDNKIKLNNRINAVLEAMAKTLYDYWFVQFDFPFDFAQNQPAANGKPYKSSGGKMIYNPTLKREIPEGWDVSSLWNIAKYYNGLAMQKYRPTDDEFLPVIKIREMNDGFSDSTEKASITIPKDAIVNDGDVLFSWSATLDVKIWSQGRGALNQHIFKVTSDKYPKTFYYFELLNYLNHFKMMAELRKTTMGHITLDHLKQAKICLPPLQLLEQADQLLEPIFGKHLLLEKENKYLCTLRDWLLPMLMNGQVTVK